MFGRLIKEQEIVLEANMFMLYILLHKDVKSTWLITTGGHFVWEV